MLGVSTCGGQELGVPPGPLELSPVRNLGSEKLVLCGAGEHRQGLGKEASSEVEASTSLGSWPGGQARRSGQCVIQPLSWRCALCAGVLSAAMTDSYPDWPQDCHWDTATPDGCPTSGGSGVETWGWGRGGQSSSFPASEIGNQDEP